MEKMMSSSEKPEDRKATFERWKQELAEREKAFSHTKESTKRELEQLRKEIDRVSESATVFLEEIYISIEEKEGLCIRKSRSLLRGLI
jgi:chromosome segregation ATPase